MSFWMSLLFAVVVGVSSIGGAIVGGAINFGRFGSNGPAIVGTWLSFVILLTSTVVTIGSGPLGWVLAAATSAFFGVMVRGATR